MLYCIKLYIGITTSRSFESFLWVLFLWEVQFLNGVQLLNVFYLFLSYALCAVQCICSCSSICGIWYSFLNKYVCMTIVAKTWPQHGYLESDLSIYFAFSNHIIIHLNPIFYLEFWWLIICVAHQMYDLLVSILLLYNYKYNNPRSSIIYCRFSGGLHIPFCISIGADVSSIYAGALDLIWYL